MLKKTLLAVLIIAITACSSSKKTTSLNNSHSVASTPKEGDDGSSFEKAIVIKETNEGKGVDAEYKWIADHYTNYKIKTQSLSYHDNKPFDIITITQSNGNDSKIYFDISNFYGKF